jgi:probable 2-oxoglutarate dehydrogenase E1 component DHKTD1
MRLWRAQLTRRFSDRASAHLSAKINPLKTPQPEFDLYTGPIAVEFEHARTPTEKDWLYREYERTLLNPLSPAKKLNILRQLLMAEHFEKFVHKKFSTYKRYSGEGTEVLVPSIYSLLESHAQTTDKTAVLSMAHRGKLAVLATLLNFPLRTLFWKIKGNSTIPEEFNKDYYYFLDDISTHLANSSSRHELHDLRVSMLPNPSHLEINGSVSMGKTRSKLDSGSDSMHIWVHGDAGIAGQGVVYECTQMAHLNGYSVNGTIHIVANNQIGFTTPENEGRSTRYCTDVLKIIGAPVLHINGMCPEEVYKASQFAVAYRKEFRNDVGLDLIGYRKYGHNEVDEPSLTNPSMYKCIRNEMKSCAGYYIERLLDEKILTNTSLEKMRKAIEDHLNHEFTLAEEHKPDFEAYFNADTKSGTAFAGLWDKMKPFHSNKQVDTGYDTEQLKEIGVHSVTVPNDITVHPIVQKGHIQNRLSNIQKGQIDWSTAEALAIGSLLKEGFNVRISGEDSLRGTFTQRNTGFICQETEKCFIPFKNFGKGRYDVFNSLLSEEAVIGFEVGYSWDNPNNLVLWEAQFGDFANMAQGIIDTYIANSEAKWLKQTGLILLLPHGQEGAGPDHSSARLERFLQLVNDPLAKQVNLGVINSVIPSNYFHLLRRQMHRDFRRPLILGTPKSGLRHKLAVSSLEDLKPGTSFRPVIYKDFNGGSDTLILCNGKVYLEMLSQFPQKTMSVMLIEELAPFPAEEIKKAISKSFKRFVWVQEEPRNSGAWSYMQPLLSSLLQTNIEVVSRPGLAAPSTGNTRDNKRQIEELFKSIGDL